MIKEEERKRVKNYHTHIFFYFVIHKKIYKEVTYAQGLCYIKT